MRTLPRLACALLGALAAVSAAGCASPVTVHPVRPSALGQEARGSVRAAMARPGVVGFQRVLFAEWQAGRGVFIDRKDPKVQAAAIPPGNERALIYAYVLDHPVHGRWLIDAGASDRLETVVGPLMRKVLKDLNITLHRTTRAWAAAAGPPEGVFLTHLHFDHVAGVLDLPAGIPLYVGPGETMSRSRINTLLGRPADNILRGRPPLNVWRFLPDPERTFAGVVDVFGDGSVLALHTPGHTQGSTAYLVMATDGPKLVTGDAVQTRFGWEQAMPQPALPGSDRAAMEDSAERLRRFAAAHPEVEVFLGHQSRSGQPEP